MLLLCGFVDSPSGRRAVRVAENITERLQAELIYDTEGHAVQLAAHGEKDYDLLALGPRRRGAFDAARRSRRLTDQARCPVMHVPAGASVGRAQRIVLVYDTCAASRAATVTAARLAERLDVTLTVLQDAADSRPYGFSAGAVTEAARCDLDAAADAGHRPDVEFVTLLGRTTCDLAGAVAELDPILVVAGKGPRPIIRRVLSPAMSMRVARRARLPIVLVAAPTPARVPVVHGQSRAT